MFPGNPLRFKSDRFVVHHQVEERAIDDVLALLESFREDVVRGEAKVEYP
jgi:hypothetical protein